MILKKVDLEKIQRQRKTLKTRTEQLKSFADNWVIGEWGQAVHDYRRRHA